MTHIPLSEIELAALLCSRVCHDVISPVGAITNGLEVMEDEISADMRDIAMKLIRQSAKQASAKLQFARLAFGSAGSAGALIDLPEAERVTKALFDGEKAELTWQAPVVAAPKNLVKLVLNLAQMGINAIPRGGTVRLSMADNLDQPDIHVRCTGDRARIPAELQAVLATDEPGAPPAVVPITALAGAAPAATGGNTALALESVSQPLPAEQPQALDARSVQPYYAKLIAQSLGLKLSAEIAGDDVVLRARY